MPLIFLTQNGIGLGHLSRTAVLCSVLKSNGFRPTVVQQGNYALPEIENVPTARIPPLHSLFSGERSRISELLDAYASLSEPGVVFEDTHPSRLVFSDRVGRVLVVRPPTFKYAKFLRKMHGHYSCFLVADAPSSPTWPYTDSETDEMRSWGNWVFLGPVYRRCRASDVERIRTRYRLNNGERVWLFSMGGGGQHRGHSDTESFLLRITEIGTQIRSMDSEARFLLVKGPY